MIQARLPSSSVGLIITYWLRPTSSSLHGSCAQRISNYASPPVIPSFHWLLCPLLSPLPSLRAALLPLSHWLFILPIFKHHSSALHHWLVFPPLARSSASLLAPSNSHPYLSGQCPTPIGSLTRPSPFMNPPWPPRLSVTHQTTSDWRRRWAHPEGHSLAARSRPEARSHRHRHRRAARSQADSRPGARRSPGARTRRGPARSLPRRRHPRAPVASRGRREERAGMGRPSLSP